MSERDERRTKAAAELQEHATEIDLLLEPGPWLRTGEVAALFGVSSYCVRQWADKGLLPSISTLGGHRLFPAEGVADALRQPTKGPMLRRAQRSRTQGRARTKRGTGRI